MNFTDKFLAGSYGNLVVGSVVERTSQNSWISASFKVTGYSQILNTFSCCNIHARTLLVKSYLIELVLGYLSILINNGLDQTVRLAHIFYLFSLGLAWDDRY